MDSARAFGPTTPTTTEQCELDSLDSSPVRGEVRYGTSRTYLDRAYRKSSEHTPLATACPSSGFFTSPASRPVVVVLSRNHY